MLKTVLLAFGLGLASLPGRAVMLPFVLPFDDAAPSPYTDLSFLNPGPAGSQGFVSVSEDGHLALGGKRQRFFGVNFTFDANFPDQAQAEACAGRLAKFGVNIVRFHHLDLASVDGFHGIWKKDAYDRVLDPVALARFDYLFSRLKARGIYGNINLCVARPLKALADLPTEIDTIPDWKARHALGFFDPQILKLQKKYASDLLAHVNPYTKMSYASDPALACVEINNENGLLHSWLGGKLDKLPAFYARELKDLWNAWLKRKYAGQEALAKAWEAKTGSRDAQMLKNPAFKSGTSGWQLEVITPAQAELGVGKGGPVEGSRCARILMKSVDGTDWHVQFHQSGLSLAKDSIYKVSFWAKADPARQISLAVGMAHDPWQPLGLNAQTEIGPAWKLYTYVFAAPTTDRQVRLNFGGLGKSQGAVYLADVAFGTGGPEGLYPDEDLKAGNIRPFLSAGETVGRTKPGRKDWTAFLVEKEEAYWQDMRAYLKKDLGVKVPVIGTIVGCSTPNLMAGLDAVDSHSYWNHPDFPGSDWNRTDWKVANDAMVNHPDKSPLANIASKHVAGKPFFCTEYNASSPNTFEAEALPLLAAYALLQDLDAVFLFDYAGGWRAWNTGKIEGYFDADQNPLKMASLVPACAAFRRGDVAAAQQIVSASINRAAELEYLLNAPAWKLVDASYAGVKPVEAMVHGIRVVTEGGTAPQGALVPGSTGAGADLKSDTGELEWDVSDPQRGVVTVNSPASRMVIGFGGGKTFELGGLKITPGQGMQKGFSIITVTALDSARLEDARKVLVEALGCQKNTGAAYFKYPSTSLLFPPEEGLEITVKDQWGKAPSQVEDVDAVLELPWPASRVTAWSLDALGKRKTKLSLSGDKARLKLGGQGTLWYGLDISQK